ncbi:DUF6547 family protein [Algoriphagus pacificus]|uniref:Uncharacterized protein n=1 Tax=Algoriphagus pacificus TaxID=2811234 RepID=A0ABS3CIU3_9BACT|nr:DUF6547 family protein [Algoriphagus pacificus]MBN7817018.1 hypothetical protein [Algoriphagus pacificus]
MNNKLDKFGKLIVEKLRDKQIDWFRGLIQGKWRSQESKELHAKLSKLTQDQKQVVADVLEKVLENSMHDFLFAIQESNDLDSGLKVFMDGENVAELSDGLHGEIFTEDGWVQRFSRHKSVFENEK